MVLCRNLTFLRLEISQEDNYPSLRVVLHKKQSTIVWATPTNKQKMKYQWVALQCFIKTKNVNVMLLFLQLKSLI